VADARAITGYIAHVLLGLYWIWMVSSTAPQLRRSSRDRQARLHILLIKTAAIALTTLVVGVIHFWATHWWHVIVAVIVAAGLGILLRRAYRRIVATPRHRLTLTQRARRFDPSHRAPGLPLRLPGQTNGAHAGRVSHRRPT
jgi:CHASE2 domain-containing sensor protein